MALAVPVLLAAELEWKLTVFHAVIAVLIVVQFVLAAGGILYIFRFRRGDKSLLELFTAGPFLFLHPGDYVAPERAKVPRMMFGAFVCLLLICVAVIWVQNNLRY